jgi:hypothetical protein
VTTIRPNPFPAAAPQAQAASLDSAKQAAQRAFFAAALGQAAAPAPAAPQPQVQTQASRPAARTPDPAAEPPQRILRPGSLLDIRV